jgi:hypothetical protein
MSPSTLVAESFTTLGAKINANQLSTIQLVICLDEEVFTTERNAVAANEQRINCALVVAITRTTVISLDVKRGHSRAITSLLSAQGT